MIVDVVCPHCHGTYKVAESNAGRMVRCAGCQTAFLAQLATYEDRSQAVRTSPDDKVCHELPLSAPAWDDPPIKRPASYAPMILLGVAVGAGAFLAGMGVWTWRHASGQPAAPPVVAGPPRFTVEQLTEALSDEDPDERSFAATELSTRGAEAAPAIAPLTKLLTDPNPNIRASAAKALGAIGIGAAGSAERLAALLNDADLNVRLTAATSLGQIGTGTEPVVAALSRALRDPDEDVRHAAVDALGKLGPSARSAVAALQDAARDGDTETRSRAKRSLQRILP